MYTITQTTANDPSLHTLIFAPYQPDSLSVFMTKPLAHRAA